MSAAATAVQQALPEAALSDGVIGWGQSDGVNPLQLTISPVTPRSVRRAPPLECASRKDPCQRAEFIPSIKPRRARRITWCHSSGSRHGLAARSTVEQFEGGRIVNCIGLTPFDLTPFDPIRLPFPVVSRLSLEHSGRCRRSRSSWAARIYLLQRSQRSMREFLRMLQWTTRSRRPGPRGTLSCRCNCLADSHDDSGKLVRPRRLLLPARAA